ncbi:MAG: DUF362 domain-containing protein [Candidatus Omnitrophota bacterium]
MKSQVAIVKCSSYNFNLVEEKIRLAISFLGGIEKFVKPKSKVLLKPNLLLAIEPEKGVTTHPALIRAVIKILKEINCDIYIGDNPSAWAGQQDLDSVYEKSGLKKLAQELDFNLVDFTKGVWHGKYLVTRWLSECDLIVSLPKFKTHDLMILTGAIKNMFGIIPGLNKPNLHKQHLKKDDFAKILVDVFSIKKPCLNIVDGIVGMEGDGPGTSGTLRNFGLILASSDAVSLDSVLATIMGLKPEVIPTTLEAYRRGLGQKNLEKIEIIGESLKKCVVSDFKLPATSIIEKTPLPILKIFKNLLKFWPAVDKSKCILCGACVKICPKQVISIKKNVIKIDYQGCISCFCCEEACAYSAMKIKKSFFAKMLRL